MTYSKKLRYVQKKIQEYITTILKVYGNELLLLLEDYNLLQNPHNCIESSTAPGFILEEFIISKLAIFTQDHDGEKEINLYAVWDNSCVIKFSGNGATSGEIKDINTTTLSTIILS